MFHCFCSRSSRRQSCAVPAALALLLLLLGPLPTAAQNGGVVRVHLLPVVNRSGEPQFDAVATTVTDTVSLTLRLLGTYRISRGAAPDSGGGERGGDVALPVGRAERLEALSELAAAVPADSVVFGEILPGGSGEDEGQSVLPRLRLSVYDRLSNSITVTGERQPGSLFDIFAATDELAAEVLSGFAGRRVAFGSIRIVPQVTPGEANGGEDVAGGTGVVPAPYRVLLDGELLGENIRTLDSILTGAHRITVLTEVAGQERTLLDEEITVSEGETLSLEVTVPSVDLAEEEAASARRAAEARLDEAIATIEAQRGRQAVEIALDYYLRASEFIDPQLLRETALEKARREVAFDLTLGQELLAEGAWERGVESHRLAAQIGEEFGQPDLWNNREEVTFVLGSWNEVTVQRMRKPTAYVPLFMSAWAVNWLLGNALTDGDSGREISDPGLQAQEVPLIPVLATTGFIAAWNTSDWDWLRMRRALRRYGESGELPEHLGPTEAGAAAYASSFRPRRWEIVPALWAGGGGQSVTLDTSGISATDSSGNPVEPEWAWVGLGAGSAPGAFQVALRRWFNGSHAVEAQLRFYPAITGSVHGVRVGLEEDDEISLETSGVPTNISAAWLYTRTGRSFLRLGLAYRYSTVGSQSRDEATEEILGQLVGGAGGINPLALGGQLGVGWRFGRVPVRPWEFELRYQLDRISFRKGFLAETGPFWGHAITFNLGRAIPLGPPVSVEPVGEDPLEELPADGAFGGRPASGRWSPTDFAILADAGGTFTYGPRFGLEWRPLPLWQAQLWGRHYIDPERFAPATALTVGSFDMLDGAMFLGLGLRRYLPGLPRFGDAPAEDPVRGAAGWYLGAELEYLQVRNFDDRSEETDERLIVDGSLVIPQLALGYRQPIWRSLSLDVGLSAGLAVGNGIDTVRISDSGSDPGILEDTTQLDIFWNNLTVAFLMPLY